MRLAAGDRGFVVANYTFLALWLVAILFPLLFILAASFSHPTAVVAGRVWLWPVEPTLLGYEAVFEYRKVWSGYANSVFYAVVGTCINVAMTIAAAYPLSRRSFFGRNVLMAVFTFTMFFSGGLIPLYLVVRSLGLLNLRAALLLPNALAVWNVIIARTFFQSNIPHELLEVSQLEGCSDYRFVLSIVLPLSGPIVAVLALFYAVGHWNAYFYALMFLNDPAKYPLQIILREILILNQVGFDSPITDTERFLDRQYLAQLLKFSLIIIASVPVLAIYPFAQRYFVKGVMIGALKG